MVENLPGQFRTYFAVANCKQFYKLKTARALKFSEDVAVYHVLHQGLLAVRRAMQANLQERRAMRRFDMRLPAIVRLEGANDFHTETQNVSARGVFFYVDHPVIAGTKVEVTLTFPPHVTLTDAVRVRFSARVVRVENPIPSARVGVAAMIENYEFLRSNGSSDFFTTLQTEWKGQN
jgi:PilZ domain-containing protein